MVLLEKSFLVNILQRINLLSSDTDIMKSRTKKYFAVKILVLCISFIFKKKLNIKVVKNLFTIFPKKLFHKSASACVNYFWTPCTCISILIGSSSISI
jgi:hypothetical protein